MNTQDLLIVVSILGPVLGFLIGSGMEFLFTRHLQNRQRLSSAVAQSFADYIKSITQTVSAANREDMTARVQAEALYVEARIRLAIYGSPSIVKALARFENTSRRLSDPQAQTAIVEIFREVRKDAQAQAAHAEDSDLRTVAFGGSPRSSQS